MCSEDVMHLEPTLKGGRNKIRQNHSHLGKYECGKKLHF